MHSKNNSATKPRLRYLYRDICTIILIIMALAMFLVPWINFVKENDDTATLRYLLGYGNIGVVSFLYGILFFLVGRFLHAFRIGVERKTKQLASVVLACFLTDFVEVFVSIAILNNYRFVFAILWRYALLAVIQSVVLAIVADIMVNIYRKLIHPLPIVLVYGDHENDIEKKINGIPQKYYIDTTVRYDDPSIDFETLIENSSCVFINDIPAEMENRIVKLCFEFNKRVYIVPKISDIILKSSESINVIDTPIYLNRNLGMSLSQRFVKRTMDILLSGVALLLLSPVFFITAIAIKIEDRGPVFYLQERVSRNGKRFMILKFRSMIVDAEKDGSPLPAGHNDNRITRVGRVIRACRIDELPQLFNILKGDMSIVGPRPERVEHVEKYEKEIPEFHLREKVKGGLTGYAQVYGKYNTTPLDKLKLDLIYITNYSLVLDIQIIFETIKIIFMKESTEGFDSDRRRKIHDSNK